MIAALLPLLLALAAADPPPVSAEDFCTSETPNCRGWQQQHDKLAWIKVENAEAEARAAVAAGDYRLYGLQGVGVVVPVAGPRALFPNGCGLRVIDGTSDMIIDAEAQFRASDYVQIYNRTVLKEARCLELPPTHRGVTWSLQDYPDSHTLSYSSGGDFGLLTLYCRGGRVFLHFYRTVRDGAPTRVALASGQARWRGQPRIEPLESWVGVPGIENLEVGFAPTEPLLTAFAATGRLSVNGEAFDARSDDERDAVSRFVAACRKQA